MSKKTPVAKKAKTSGKQPHRWKPGESGNPHGRPRDGESWAAVIKRISNMTGQEAAQYVNEFAKFFRPMKGITLKEAVILRSFAALLFDPQASMLNAIMERAEGKLSQTIRTWQDEVIDLLKTGQVTPAIVRNELGDELARELFIAAGVPLADDRPDQTSVETEATVQR